MSEQHERRSGTSYTGEERRADPSGIRGDIAEIKVNVKNIYRAIYGNKEPGLKVKVDRNTEARIKQEEEEKESKSRSWGMVVAIVIALLNGGIAIAIAFSKTGG